MRLESTPARTGIQDELALTQWDPVARVVVHAYLAFLVTDAITNVIPVPLDVCVVDGLAALFRRRNRAPILHVLLDAVACVAARSRAGCRRDLLAVAVANLMAYDRTDHRTDGGTRHLLAVFDRRPIRNRHVVTFLTRGANGLLHWFYVDHPGVLGLVEILVSGNRATCSGRGDTGNHSDNQRLVHAITPSRSPRE